MRCGGCPSRREPRLGVQVGQRLGQRKRAFARRIDQPPLRTAIGGQLARRHLEQIARHEAATFARQRRCARHSRAHAAPACRCPRCPAPRAPGVASGSVKLPRPQNQSITRSSRCTSSSRNARADQHAVDVRIDLREVGRLERHRDAELGQRVGQLVAALVQQLHASRAPWAAATTARRAATPKSRRRSQVGVAQRLEMAQHQRHHLVAGRQLDLRQAVALRPSQPISSRSGSSNALTCGGSTGAAVHVGHVARLALVEADQHRALLAHVAHRQARPIAVAPGRALRSAAARSRARTLPRCHRLSSSARCLTATCAAGCRCCILQPPQAPACRPKCGQRRAHALRTLTLHRGQASPAPSCSCARFTCTWTVSPGKRAFDEHHLAVGRRAPRPAPRGRATPPSATRRLPSWARIIRAPRAASRQRTASRSTP